MNSSWIGFALDSGHLSILPQGRGQVAGHTGQTHSQSLRHPVESSETAHTHGSAGMPSECPCSPRGYTFILMKLGEQTPLPKLGSQFCFIQVHQSPPTSERANSSGRASVGVHTDFQRFDERASPQGEVTLASMTATESDKKSHT